MDVYVHKLLITLLSVILLLIAIFAIYLGSRIFRNEFAKLSIPQKKIDFADVVFALFFFFGGLGAFIWSVATLVTKIH